MTARQIEKLVYRSLRADRGEAELSEMFDRARVRNAEETISGALVYDDRRFLQILEGPRPALAECFLRIARSRLHRGIEIATLEPSPVRLFMTWHLAVVPLDRPATSLDGLWRRIMRTPANARLAGFEAAFLQWIPPDR